MQNIVFLTNFMIFFPKLALFSSSSHRPRGRTEYTRMKNTSTAIPMKPRTPNQITKVATTSLEPPCSATRGSSGRCPAAVRVYLHGPASTPNNGVTRMSNILINALPCDVLGFVWHVRSAPNRSCSIRIHHQQLLRAKCKLYQRVRQTQSHHTMWMKIQRQFSPLPVR